MAQFHTSPLFLIYRDDQGDLHSQPWQDLTTAGTPIDPVTGDDMELVGWNTSAG
ncbi:hypothetical protein [Mycolicibacterium aubagnense]|uniref:Uncharacterized protein n=1 Tax=Mycolicibacterium aubagnense TaxID=319707 RepID=A0ABN5YKN4_9MYCO|nr:hypothetical protein [Mycolicibacterium aubagnense]BBX82232.1 hypothetical protein MAUB_01050 [Mycolicibacterium aubagnense]